MKILLLPSYLYPENAASLYLGENLRSAFAGENFDTELFAPTPSRGIDKTIRKAYKKRKREITYQGKLITYRFPMFPEGKNPVVRTLRYFLCHIVHLYKGIQSKNIDILFIASTPPTQGAMGALVKKIKGIPMVYNLQDIFPDSLVATGLTHKGSLLWKLGRIIEDFTYRNADKIIVISEGFKRNIMEKGVPESKIEVIYNWVDESAVIPVERNENILFERYNLPLDKFYITYCGNIGLTQNMDLLLEVVEMLREKPGIHFILIGEGAYKQEVEKQIKEKQLNNITLLPFQAYEDISHVFSLGDVGLVISKAQVGQNSVPSKTWSILSAGRPVLASFDPESELQSIIEDNQLGIFAEAGNKLALYNAILFLHHNKELCLTYGKNGRAFILKNLSREAGTSKYVQVLKSVFSDNEAFTSKL